VAHDILAKQYQQAQEEVPENIQTYTSYMRDCNDARWNMRYETTLTRKAATPPSPPSGHRGTLRNSVGTKTHPEDHT
jgi:hypothetical protein